MLDQFCATLEAINPERDCYRAYRIVAGTDLLGDWLVEITYGRIGRAGHQLRYCVPNETAAQKLVKTTFANRTTAKKRIGVNYQFKEIRNPRDWMIRLKPELQCKATQRK